jgi:hypothetical protein
MAPKPQFQKKEYTPAYPTWKPEIGKTYNEKFGKEKNSFRTIAKFSNR